MEWASIEKMYAIKADDRTREEVLTEQASEEKRSLNDSAANFVSDVLLDLQSAFTHSKSPIELCYTMFSVFTKGDRGIIFGVLLIIISLSLLTLRGAEKIDA
mgnify:CR=1 FL=1